MANATRRREGEGGNKRKKARRRTDSGKTVALWWSCRRLRVFVGTAHFINARRNLVFHHFCIQAFMCGGFAFHLVSPFLHIIQAGVAL